jgi:hypothetical protein
MCHECVCLKCGREIIDIELFCKECKKVVAIKHIYDPSSCYFECSLCEVEVDIDEVDDYLNGYCTDISDNGDIGEFEWPYSDLE